MLVIDIKRLSICVFIGALLFASASAQLPKGAHSPGSQKGAQQSADANAHKNATENAAPAINQTVTVQLEPAPDKADGGVERELAEYTHQLMVWTAVLAVATTFLIAIGWYQATQMRRAVDATTTIARSDDRRTNALERAYAWASPRVESGNPIRQDSIPIALKFVIEAENYGRTPAIVKEVRWQVCPLASIPETPDYATCNRAPSYLVLSPQQRWRTKARGQYRLDWTEPHAIYGRLYYEDVFRRPHSSGFLLRLKPDTREHFPIEGYPKHTHWD